MKCKDKPTAQLPIEIVCVACGGRASGCKECKSGWMPINRCPLEVIGPEAWDLVELAELTLEHGLTPVAGGMLDQTACFLDAMKLIGPDRAHLKKELR